MPIASSRRWFVACATIAAGVAVFWAFDALPFQDLPAHAGLMALRHRLATSPFEQRFFILAPHLGPYSFFRATGDLLVAPLGPIGAVRLLMTLPVVALPAALGWARHRLHGDGALQAASTGLCLAFGFMTLLGFASYLIGVAALVVAYALWLDGLRGDRRGAVSPAEAAVAGAAVVVVLLHGYAFVVLLALAAASTIAARPALRELLRLRAFAPSVALAGLMVWEDRTQGAPAVASPGMAPGPHFAGLLDKLGLLFSATLMTRWGLDLAVGMALWVLLGGALLATVRARPGPVTARLAGSLGALALLAGAFVALPRSVGWFGFVDGRLVPLVLATAALAVEREAMPRWARLGWDHGIPLAAIALVAIAWAASYRFQTEARGWRDVVAAIPEGSRLLNLPLDPDSDVFTAHPFVHYDKLAVAAKPVVVSDVWFHQGTALYPTAENPALHLPASYSESNLQWIDVPAYRFADWDYVLVRTRPGASRPPVPDALAPVLHEGGFWLFRH